MLLLLLRGLGLGRGVRFLFLRLSQRNTARSGFTHAKGGMKKKTDRVAERERDDIQTTTTTTASIQTISRDRFSFFCFCFCLLLLFAFSPLQYPSYPLSSYGPGCVCRLSAACCFVFRSCWNVEITRVALPTYIHTYIHTHSTYTSPPTWRTLGGPVENSSLN